jgi:2-oxoglutarate ferredoxin oxidoreductase subunit gamma
MQNEVIIVGTGGQGILFAGTILAEAAIRENKEATWYPSYGAEMRGGLAHCTVVISDEEIASPITKSPECVIALSTVGYDLYVPLVRSNGILFINTSIIKKEEKRNDVEIIKIPVTSLAEEVGDAKVANMVALGAYAAKVNAVSINSLILAIKEVVNDKSMIDLNIKAIEKGAYFITTHHEIN